MNDFRILRLFVLGATATLGSMVGGISSDYANTQFEAKPGPLPFEYMEAPDQLPNYTPGARWGTQGAPIRSMQKPLEPEQSIERLVTFPEFDISLFAAEPEALKPLWLAFDHRGRLWIAESVDYPNQLQPEGQGRDRLKILEDTDGDGLADKYTIFADKLSIPTSFVFAEGGVIGAHSGKMELLKDTDGDEIADSREVLIEGWGTNDTHATVSNLRYGFDNWIWGVVGYSGFEGSVNGEELRFGQGIFRFRPDGSKLEFIRSSNNNTWGLDFTEDNIVIGSTANGNASMYMPIPNRYYETVSGWSAARLESIATSQGIFPITEKVRQVDWHGQYTAGSGSGLYTARSFPEPFWNRAQFVAEPTGHLLGLFFLERSGADFIAHNAHNMLASDDEWTAPVYGEVGPDGALWVVDWYNYIVQHNPTPIGFETGRGNAYETNLRDKIHGRIYRVSYRDGTPSEFMDLDPMNPTSLVVGLQSDNKLWRLHAQRLLVERGDADVVPQLIELLNAESVDELGLNPAAIHALWTMKGLGVLDSECSMAVDAARGALSHRSDSVRRAAVMVLPRNEDSLNAVLDSAILRDEDAQARMAGFLALSEFPRSEDAAVAILRALESPANHDDRWLLDAATAAAARNDDAFLRALFGRTLQRIAGTPWNANGLTPGLERLIRVVSAHYADRGPNESIIPVLTSLNGVPTAVSIVALDGLMSGWPEGVSPNPSEAEKARLEFLMDRLDLDARDRLLRLSKLWNTSGLFEGRLEAIVASLREQVEDTELEASARAEAARRWVELEESAEAVAVTLDQITLTASPKLSGALLNALSFGANRGVAEAILGHWESFTPAARRAAVGALLRRPEWALALLDAIQDESIDRADLAPEHWSQLQRNPSRRVAGLARRLAERDAGVSPDRAEVVERLLPLAREEGDAARGKEVFEASCAVCHIFNGEGGAIGPELTGISSRDRADVLLEIFDPNRSVEANYRLWTVSDNEGALYSGRLEAETQTTIEILDLTGVKHVIQRKNIDTLQALPQSIMPIGFEALPAADIKGLLEYLATPH